jgi:hypothetical protein
MIKAFTKFGYSFCAFKSSGGTSGAPTALTASYQAFPITVDATNSVNSLSFPDDCEVQVIEFELTARDSATSVTMYLARDSAGDIPITNPSTENITNGVATATKGGVAFSSVVDYHFDRGTLDTTTTPDTDVPITNTSSGTLYVIAKQAGGTNARGNIRVYWRS